MNRRFSTFALLVAASLVGACGGGEPKEEAAPPEESAQAEQAALDEASPLLTPAALTDTAPETYHVRFETSVGAIVVQVNRAWSPNGADRFYNLVKNGYYDDTRFFRVVEGLHGPVRPERHPPHRPGVEGRHVPGRSVHPVQQAGHDHLRPRRAEHPHHPGVLQLQGQHAPGRERVHAVRRGRRGLDVMDKIYAGYGELPPAGNGPDYSKAWVQGNAYLDTGFPEMTKVLSATLEAAGA